MTVERLPVVVIGAGPAGLALGRALRQRGVGFQIIEKNEVGGSWRRMPKDLKLVSPWKWNWLASESRHRFGANVQLTRAQFFEYLNHFARENELPIESGCEVQHVERAEDGFHLETSQGDLRAEILVNATGYFSNPVVPRIPGIDHTEVPCIHFAQYSSALEIAERVGRNRSVLIVGKRLSAGQLALELFDAGLSVAISHRSPIRFGVDDWLWPVVYRTFAHIEALRLCFGLGRPLDVRMPGGRVRNLIEGGTIQCFPSIAEFQRNRVAFENGQEHAPGLVIFATGFAPALGFLPLWKLATCPETGVPLTRNMESVSVPNLFFLGFEMVRNFQSRFLRGIRNDAVVLASIIEARLANVPKLRPELCRP